MNNRTIIEILVVVLVVAAGGWYVYMHGTPATQESMQAANNFGTYNYECDEHVAFSLSPASDMSSVHVAPANGGAYPPESTLVKKEAGTSAAARYEGNGIVLTATGETVTLGEGDSAINCSPVPNGDNAPFNWGDAGAGAVENGSVKQDTSLIVSESIQGKWQSTDDAKFVREFKSGAVVVDSYDGKAQSQGLWVAFTKANAPKVVPFPMEDNTVYIQMTETGSQADTLNFKVAKLTPDELDLIYMDRGNTLSFKHVQ